MFSKDKLIAALFKLNKSVLDEVEVVLDNKTIWMDADEIIERFTKMQEKLQEEFEAELDGFQDEIEETPPKKKNKLLT